MKIFEQIKQLHKQAAFSLLEMSIVVGILGIIIAGGLTIGVGQLEQTAQDNNKDRITVIEDAILAYRLGQDRLPCPADITLTIDSASFGIESFRGDPAGPDKGKCSTNGANLTGAALHANFGPSGNVVAGGLPTKTLGLQDELAFDSYGRHFVYYVDARMTKDDAFDSHPVDANTNVDSSDDVGEIVVNDANGNPRTAEGIYAIVSHGADGHGGYTRAGVVLNKRSTNTDEQDNCNCDNTASATAFDAQLVQKIVEGDPNDQDSFDDIVIFKNRSSFYSGKDDVAVQVATPSDSDSDSSCPNGFVALEGGTSVNSKQGCIQVDLAFAGSKLACRDAHKHCYDYYGGRLPTYSEIYASHSASLINNLGNGNSYEHLDGTHSSSTCDGIYHTAITSTSLGYTTPYHFRCFIPVQPVVEKVPVLNSGMYEDYPDVIKCSDGTVTGNFYLQTNDANTITYSYADESQYVTFTTADKSYSAHSGGLAAGCNGKSIDDIISAEMAFWFVNADNYCPDGFTVVESNDQVLGCVQNVMQGTDTCANAISDCWSSHGGRLPSYAEMVAGLSEPDVSISGVEWNDGVTGASACATYDSGDPGSDTSSDSNMYRCFIPLANRSNLNSGNICPQGFVSVEKEISKTLSRSIGCIQQDLASGGADVTGMVAIDYCYDTYGGRLPGASEIHIAIDKNLISSVGGNDFEWLQDAAAANSQGAIAASTYYTTVQSYTSKNQFRCFIPPQPSVKEVANTDTAMYSNWPDALKCENAVSGAQEAYHYLIEDQTSRTGRVVYGNGRGDSVEFNSTSGAYISGVNAGLCSGKTVWEISTEGNAFYLKNETNTCPMVGFEHIYKNGKSIGCIQVTKNTAATCQNAAKNCWDTYGARLPAFDEAVIASDLDFISIGSNEWVDGATGPNTCATIGTGDTPGESASSGSLVYRWEYRCFIGTNGGLLDKTYEYDYNGPHMLEQWPDAVMCENSGTTESRYFYLSSQYSNTDSVNYHHAKSGTEVVFRYSDESFVSAPAGFDCKANSWNLVDFVDNDRAYLFGALSNTGIYCVGASYLGVDESDQYLPELATYSDYYGAKVLDMGEPYDPGKADYSASCFIGDEDLGYCWGNNAYGQLGIGNRTNMPIAQKISAGHKWSKIASGLYHVCGIAKDGDGYCWGRNAYGELGNGTGTNKYTPTLVSGGHKWIDISAGNSFSCGITMPGKAYCWGYNAYGQLGNGTSGSKNIPTAISSRITFKSIHAFDGTVCAVATGGDGYCWGRGTSYEIGDGTRTNKYTPTLVSGGHKWEKIEGSSYNVCGLTTSGKIYCWGSDNSGALGNGARGAQSSPGLINDGGSMVWKYLGVGFYSACGINTAGEAYCWGEGGWGGDALGTSTDPQSPVYATHLNSHGNILDIDGAGYKKCVVVEMP